MFARIRRGLSFANVCSLLALVIALSTGTAYAANTVFSEDIVNGEVKTVDIAADAVKTGKVEDDAITSAKVLNGTLTGGDLGTHSVGSDEVANAAIGSDEVVNESLTASDLAPNSVGNSELIPDAVTGAKVASNSLTTSDIAGASVNGHVSVTGIANGRCSNVTFNVSGAQVGEVPVVTTGAATQNGIIMLALRVESAGHVSVAVCNMSGTTMTPLVDLAVRVITFS